MLLQKNLRFGKGIINTQTFEENISIIDEELKKRRNKWYLNNIIHLDFDDVCQIIRQHVYKKWILWDQNRPLRQWLNTVISNQIKNLIRNNYGSFAKPCTSCPFNQGGEVEDLCSFTPSGHQNEECPVYAKWAKRKKDAFNVKVPTSYDRHSFEINCEAGSNIDIDSASKKLHEKMKERLTEKQFMVYKMIFIDGISEEQAAINIGYKTSEKNRKAGYGQITNLKKIFRKEAEKILQEEDIFFNI